MKTAAAMLILLITTALGNGTPIRIMPLGDSITHGWWSGITTDLNGYRKELHNLLMTNGYTVDFVGSLTDGDFADPEHEGHDGWYAAHDTDPKSILDHSSNWVATADADIILLHVGTNDINHDNEDAAEVSGIIDRIFLANSNATVVVALIISTQPGTGSLAPEITLFNSNVNAMAQSRISSGDDIMVVDMENGAGLDYAAADMNDRLHPTQLGYDKMATNWFPAVQQAITNQWIKALAIPVIDAISISGGTTDLSISQLTTGQLFTVQQALELSPPAWSNIGAFTPVSTATNWTVPTTSDQAFYRITIP